MDSRRSRSRMSHVAVLAIALGLVLSFHFPLHSAVNRDRALTGASAGWNFIITRDILAEELPPVHLRLARSSISKLVVSPSYEAAIRASFVEGGHAVHIQVVQKGSTLARIDAVADEQGIAVGTVEISSQALSLNEPIRFRVSFSGDRLKVHDRLDITGTLRAAVLPPRS